MSLELIERDFREKVGAKIRLMPEGIQRWRVLTPFQFEDGGPSRHRSKTRK